MNTLEEFSKKIEGSSISQEEKTALINWIKTLPEDHLNLFNGIFTSNEDILELSQNYIKIGNLLKNGDPQGLEDYIKQLTEDLKKLNE